MAWHGHTKSYTLVPIPVQDMFGFKRGQMAWHGHTKIYIIHTNSGLRQDRVLRQSKPVLTYPSFKPWPPLYTLHTQQSDQGIDEKIITNRCAGAIRKDGSYGISSDENEMTFLVRYPLLTYPPHLQARTSEKNTCHIYNIVWIVS